MSIHIRKSISDGDKGCDTTDKIHKTSSKTKNSTSKADSKGERRNHKRTRKGEDVDDKVNKSVPRNEASVKSKREVDKKESVEFDGKPKEDKDKVEEKLRKLVHILESSEDREEKLEALRLIAEIAETLPDVGTYTQDSLDINDIPLPSLPQIGTEEIPLPSDPPPSPAGCSNRTNKEVGCATKLDSSCSKSNGLGKIGCTEETAVTKTRLGVVTLHKNKTSLSNRLQVTRQSLNELMAIDKSGKFGSKSKLKKKLAKGADSEAALNDSKEVLRREGASINVGGRRAEIQQRINAWREELLRDLSKDPKRRKYSVNLLDMTSPADVNGSRSVAVANEPVDRCVTWGGMQPFVKEPKDGLLGTYSRSVLSAEGSKRYLWPVEMIRHTSAEPSISYGCNPLYYEFPPHISVDKSDSTVKSAVVMQPNMHHDGEVAPNVMDSKTISDKNVAAQPSIQMIKNVPEVGFDPVTEKKSSGKTSKPRVSPVSAKASIPCIDQLGNTFDGDENDDKGNVANWDTTSESETENSQYSASPQKCGNSSNSKSEPKLENSHMSRKRRNMSPASDHSSGTYTSSGYAYRSCSASSHSSRSRSKSSSASYSSGYSKRSSRSHRHSYRSYSRSSRYSSTSYSSCSSSDSYYSSRSRSSRRKRKKRRRASRSLSLRSRSKDRFGRRISRSPSMVSRKRVRSTSKESKRIISHKVLPKKFGSPSVKANISVGKIKVEIPRPQGESSCSISTPSVVNLVSLASSSLSIPLPNKSALSQSSASPSVSSTEPKAPFIGPTLPDGHPLSVTQDIPLPAGELSQEEKFQPIGPNDPLVFKTKPLPSSAHPAGVEKDERSQQEKDLPESFIIPPEQAERYRALRLQAERHARKVMGGLTEEEEAEEEDPLSSTSIPPETPNQVGNGSNPQQQLVEELYFEQMASFMAQQQQQQQQLVVNTQAPTVSRLVQLVGGQQNVSAPQFIPLVQVGTKVVQAIPQAGAPLILAHQNTSGHIATATMLGSQVSSPMAGSTLVQVPAEDTLQARARLQQVRLELAEKAMERQEWVQIVQLPQQQPQHHGLILTHHLHHQGQVGLPMIHRPNIILGAARKTPTLIQVPAAGQIVTPAFIGAQQVVAAQPAQQVALPFFLGANGQVLVPKFIR